MRRYSVIATVSFVFLTTMVALAEPPKSVHEKEEAAIREAIAAYTQAYNQGNAEGVANLWSEVGEWISPSGQRVHGRRAIAAELAQVFKQAPGLSIEVNNPSIRFITNDVAIEDGTVRVSHAGRLTSEASYVAVHVKREGKWQLDSVRETEIPDLIPAHENLKALEWLVGEWIDQAEDSTVETKVAWTKNKQFLTCNFRVSFPNLEPLEGVQVIAWDPAEGAIRSWVFDSAGTIGKGVWSHDGKRWLVKSTQVLADGSQAAATNIYTFKDANSYSWKSIGRTVGNEFLPNIDEVLVVRKSLMTLPKDDAPHKPEPQTKSATDKPAIKSPVLKPSKNK